MVDSNVIYLFRPALAAPDPDLREYQREMALSAISNRTTSKIARPLQPRTIDRKSSPIPLFDLDDDDELLGEQPVLDYSEVNDDHLVAYAVQESFDDSNSTKNVASTSQDKSMPATLPASSSRATSPEDDFYMDYPAPTRLETALSIANAAGSSRVQSSPSQASVRFGKPTLLSGPSRQPQMLASLSSSDEEIQRSATPEQPTSSSIVPTLIEESDDDSDMEEVPALQATLVHNALHDNPPLTVASPRPDKFPSPPLSCVPPTEEVLDASSFQGPVIIPQDTDLDHDPLFIISRTPSPSHEARHSRPPSPPIVEDWDAAEEMDVQAEEGEFARFISQVKGKDLGSVRKEIDDEIKALNEQRKAAMRDSEDITQQSVSQIMVRNTFSPLTQMARTFILAF